MVPLKFALIGGDGRAGRLGALLARDGHRVQSFALEKAERRDGVTRAGSLQGCVYGADWVLLGMPAEKKGLLNTPLAVQELSLGELISVMWPGQVLCGGGLSQESRLAAVRAGLTVCDLLARRDFSVGNAAVTAEGAIGLLLQNGERCLWGSHVLVTGWGRIASLLAPRLRALGAYVTAAARKPGDRAMAEAMGLGSCAPEQLELMLEDVDFLVNTVPAPLLDEGLLRRMKPGALLLELASEPGFDRERAEALGLRTRYAPGLPGRSAPETAAALMRDTIYAVIREREENDGG